jgi:hypothetical protein
LFLRHHAPYHPPPPNKVKLLSDHPPPPNKAKLLSDDCCFPADVRLTAVASKLPALVVVSKLWAVVVVHTIWRVTRYWVAAAAAAAMVVLKVALWRLWEVGICWNFFYCGCAVTAAMATLRGLAKRALTGRYHHPLDPFTSTLFGLLSLLKEIHVC